MEAVFSDRSGAADLLTISEGLTSREIVERLKAIPELSGEITAIPAEGSLLPQTYFYQRGDSRVSLLNRMASEHDRALAEIWSRRTEDLPISSRGELVALASIVAKESAIASQRNRVASVFVNRLRRGLPLQSEQTSLYDSFGGSLPANTDPAGGGSFERPGGYETFQKAGLPPGPIGNPGRAALEAAANPAKTRDLYFVRDGLGGLAFAASADEHRQNVTRLRQAEAADFSGAVETTWIKVRENNDPSMLREFASRFPDSRHRTEAEARALLLIASQPVGAGFRDRLIERATLDEESPAQPGLIAARFTGMLSWNLVERQGEHPSIEAALHIPDRDFLVLVRLQKNSNPSLGVSHLLDIEIATPPSGSAGGIEKILRLNAKTGAEEAAHAIAGAVRKGADGLFWIALAGENLTLPPSFIQL